jgi:hypothetical protein
MTKVYIVHHEYLLDERNEVKLIGVYSSQEMAEHAVERFRGLPGFREHPDGFHIDAYPIDEDHWTSGFVTVRPGEDSG